MCDAFMIIINGQSLEENHMENITVIKPNEKEMKQPTPASNNNKKTTKGKKYNFNENKTKKRYSFKVRQNFYTKKKS